MDRRSPLGERGLKLTFVGLSMITQCRSPLGERGLKYGIDVHLLEFV